MSDKKDTGTALVPSIQPIEPLSTSLVPHTGYGDLLVAEKEKKGAQQELIKASSITVGGAGLTVLGVGLAGLISPLSPYFIGVALLMISGSLTAIGGMGLSFYRLLMLVRANRQHSLPPGKEHDLALMEGAAYSLIDTWNKKSECWNEGWQLLVQEEKDLFALQDRCTSKKSMRGLVKRIELVRKEKRKHLKVRAKLEVERDHIMSGIEAIKKRLPPAKEPQLLTDGEDNPS